MALTQPFRTWQLAFAIVAIVIPVTAAAQNMDSVTRVHALEGEFPRDVVLVGELPDGISEQDWATSVEGALAEWNDVPCSNAELRYVGRVASPEDVASGTTAVAFVDPSVDRCFAIPTDIGWTLITPCDGWQATAVLLNAADFRWARDPSPYQAFDDGIVDVRSVLTHELGHVLGLHHDDVVDPLATMAPRYLRDGGLASLAAQDKRVLCAMYPRDVWECSLLFDEVGCPGGGVCLTGSLSSGGVCEEPRADIGDYCDLANLNCGMSDLTFGDADNRRCLVTSGSTYSGYCTADCDRDEDCPEDMSCVGDPGECRYTPIPRVDDGCSTASGGRTLPPLFLLGFATFRRRSRARLRSR